jgi:hypothetical protein
VTGTKDPIDLSITSLIGSPTNAHLKSSWAVMFKNEYLRWINDKVYALNLSMPRESLQDAWTQIEMAAYSTYVGIEADCGAVCDFGSGPNLYIGGPDGKIVKMFAAQTFYFTGTWDTKANCPMINNVPSLFIDSVPQRVGVRVGNDTTGDFYAFLIDDRENVYSIGSNSVGTETPLIASDIGETGTFTIPVGAPSVYITFRATKVNTAFSWTITLHAPSGATETLDYTNVSDETTAGATINLWGAPSETGWTGTYEVRCTV